MKTESKSEKETIKIKRSYIIIFILFLVPFLSIYNSDIHANIRQGMNVWEALFQGRFFEYYSVNAESVAKGQMIHLANYDMLLNILYGIWQFPLYVIEKIIGGDILDHYLARIWGKTIHLIAMWCSAYLVRKIAKEMDLSEERCDIACFMYLSGSLVILSALNASQVDILGINWILLAAYYLIKEDRKRFILFFILGVQFKEFAWLIFLPVILMLEKNIWKLVKILFTPFIIQYLLQLSFKLADPAGVALRKSRVWIQMDWLTRSRFSLFGGYDIPVVFIALGIIVMFAYHKVINKKDRELRIRSILYMSMLSMLAIMVCTCSNAHWCIYIVPFYLLLLCSKKDKLFIRIMLESAGTLSLTVAYVIIWSGVFDCTDGMLIDLLTGGRASTLIDFEAAFEILMSENYFNFWTLSLAAFAVWAIGFLYYNNPFRKQTTIEKTELSESEEKEKNLWENGTEKSISILLWLRAIAAFVICDIVVFIRLFLCFK